MPRRNTHLKIGFATGAGYSLALQAYRNNQNPQLISAQHINLLHIAVCSIAAAVGSCIPDVIEPASRTVGPNHRGAFHSVATGATVVMGAYRFAKTQPDSAAERWVHDIAGAFCAGYASHLAADALLGVKGLCFICKGF